MLFGIFCAYANQGCWKEALGGEPLAVLKAGIGEVNAIVCMADSINFCTLVYHHYGLKSSEHRSLWLWNNALKLNAFSWK